MKNIFLSIWIGMFSISACESLAHERDVHKAITVNAADSAIESSQTFKSFVSVISSDISYAGVTGLTNALAFGSFHEDDLNEDSGGARSYNHFYDPLDHTYGKGLSDYPPDLRVVTGNNSFIWASTFDCPGINFYLPLPNVNTINTRSWQNARAMEWAGLTSSIGDDRNTALTNMFTDLGQVMHLLEDASQPQHVRNEQHLVNSPWQSPIEKWGKKNIANIAFSHGMLDWRAAGFLRLEDFWDRHIYNGSGQALNADLAGGSGTLGLAEWCNGNFLGVRHSYAEFSGSQSIKHYPYPALSNTTQPQINPNHIATTVIDKVTLENGKQGDVPYISKIGGGNPNGSGIPITHHSALHYLAVKHPPKINGPEMIAELTINDSNVLQEYHSILIPKVIKYSAGLLDYFCRGQIEPCVSISVAGDGNWILTIQNSSGETWSDGGFTVLQDAEGTRTILLQSDLTEPLPDGETTELRLTSVPSADTKALIIVYRGTIGLTGTDPSDPVDAGIAIASTKIIFGSGPIWSQMNWDVANFYTGGSSGSAAGDTVQFSLEGKTDTPFLNGVAEVHGSLSYTGGPAIGKLHINFDSVNDSDFGLEILQDSNVVMYITIDDLVEGDNEFIFPISCGDGSTIEVEGTGYNHLMGLASGDSAGAITLSLKLSNESGSN